MIDGPAPIAPCRLDTQLIDDATLPCSGSTAVAVSVTFEPRSTEVPEAGLVIFTTGARLTATAPPTAAAALTMPPVAMTPSSALIGRAVCRMRSRIWATVHVGWSDSTSAATPATCGLAIEVPLLYP